MRLSGIFGIYTCFFAGTAVGNKSIKQETAGCLPVCYMERAKLHWR
jgi:hypothetical protein